MSKCTENTKKVFRAVAPLILPALIPRLAGFQQAIQTASTADPLFWTDHNKRAAAVSYLKAESFKATGKDLAEGVARLANEAILFSVTKAQVALEDLAHPLVIDADGDGIPDTPPLPGGGA